MWHGTTARKTALLLAAAAATARASLQVVSGATWTATNQDVHMQAHGAGVIQVDSTYYLIGEDHSNGSAFQNVNCYSSDDLVRWTYVGALLSQTEEDGDLGPDRVLERPKVIYNEDSGQYVMWMHIDDSSYSEAKVGVAVGTEVCGTYEYQGSWQPLGFQSRDMGLFKDSDGSAYLLTEDRENGLRIDALTSDYLNVSEATYLYSEDYEAPAMIRLGDTYYMFASQESGWDPNDNMYSTATSLSGPWSDWSDFAESGSDTYSSQTNYVLPFGDSVIYLGDRWVSTNLMASTYVWLPLDIDGTNVSMSNYVNWVPDVSAGTWAAGPSETWPEAENATLSGGAQVVSCSGCSGGEAVGDIGGASNGTLTFSGVESDASTLTTIRIKYENGDSAQRRASVAVNGAGAAAQAQAVAFLPTADGNTPGSSVVHAQLSSGADNTVVISGASGADDASWGPDVDRIMVPVS
ncbi:galactan 1,3-beta-galactosidase [Xylariaceae sp. FL0804]|nr:galactan 1,3-beta-galactosidase [Xylariaceae sp. FL0804]